MIKGIIISIVERKQRKELQETLIKRYGRKKGLKAYHNIIRYHMSNKKEILEND